MTAVQIVFVSVFFGGGIFGLVVVSVVRSVHGYMKHQRDVSLKIKMVEKGYSVEDIKRLTGMVVDYENYDDSDEFPEFNKPCPPVKSY